MPGSLAGSMRSGIDAKYSKIEDIKDPVFRRDLEKSEAGIVPDKGSTIKLKCMVENIVGEQPEYIIWKKGNRMLNYDTERGGIR